MRTLLTIISTIIFLNSNGQTTVSFVFYDACNKSVIELPCFVNDIDANTTIRVEAGQSIVLSSNYYQLEVQMNWNEMITSFWFDVNVNEQPRTDTLYLQTARFFGPTYLHAPPDKFKHYCCGELCNGAFEEQDSDGITRFKGRFRNGIPTTNLKYYDSSGERTRTEVYVNGKLKRIK